METIAGQVRGRKQSRADEWVWMFQERLRLLAVDKRMKGMHWRVLAYVWSCVTFAQDLRLKQQDVVQALHMDKADVSRCLRDLATLGVLTRVDTHEYPATYRLNSLYIYKGHGEKLPQRRAHQRKERVRD